MGPARLPSYLVTNSILCLLDLMLSTVYISNSTSFAKVWIFLFWIFLPTHSPVSTGWRSRSIFSLRWRQSSIVHWTIRLLTTLAADLRRLSDMPSRRRLRSSLTDHLDVRQSQLETEHSLWLVLNYGTVCHMTSSRVKHCHISVVDSTHFYLDSHILLFCFSS